MLAKKSHFLPINHSSFALYLWLNNLINDKMNAWAYLEDILVPLGMCVVLPVLVVWLAMRKQQNDTNRKAEVMLKAIEAGKDIDPDYFKEPDKNVSIKQKLLRRLTWACITLFIGAIVLTISLIASAQGKICYEATLGFSVFGGIMIAIGAALFIAFFVGRNMLAKEIEAEEKNLEAPQQ